ncbi:MAG: cupin domain-containing protein [Clostridiales bacterium]|nr:cupin domain-containing protein [Clostridiales bacterium]
MIEKLYNYSLEDKTIVEKLIDTKDLALAHAIVEKGGRFPTHNSNAQVRIIIVKGELSIKLNKQDIKVYKKSTILEIPFDTTMELMNNGSESLEFFAIKAPSPSY